MSNDKEQARCGKCWSYLDDKDNFCRNCGTKKGEGVGGGIKQSAFSPSQNVPPPVYGPPPPPRPPGVERVIPPKSGDSAFDPNDNIAPPVYGPPPSPRDDDDW